MSYIGAVPTTASFPFDQFSGNGSTTAFTLTYAPASTTSIIVAISGVVQNPNLYSVIGTTITFSPAPPTGTNNISVLYLGLPVIGVSSPGNTAYFSSTSFTATGGQTTFTPSGSYQVGFINVIRNGAQLAPANYTATNGTTVTLLNACTAGDIVVIEVYTLTSISNALPLTGGTVTGASTFNSTLTVNGANVSGFTGFKNRIINPEMDIDQRNAGAAVTPANATVTYTLDRWFVFEDTDGACSVQQVADAPTGFVNSLRFTTTTADSSLSASQRVFLAQRIEGFNIADLAWGTASAAPVAFSFSVKSSLTGTFGGALQNGAFNRAYPFTYTISAANTWEQKTVTIAGDTTGTWATNNTSGMQVAFGLGVGTANSGTAGSWAASNLQSATGAVSVIGTLNATFAVTGVQLERGSNATSFEFRDYGRELILCQRYFETNYDTGTAPSNGVTNLDGYKSGVRTAAELYGLHQIKFQVTKRGQPTITYYQPVQIATSGQWGYYDGSVWVASTNTRTDNVGFTSFGVVMASNTLTGQNAYLVQGGWAASSEL
jgi:hypothetical protein